jgi:hypothetical protein
VVGLEDIGGKDVILEGPQLSKIKYSFSLSLPLHFLPIWEEKNDGPKEKGIPPLLFHPNKQRKDTLFSAISDFPPLFPHPNIV